MPHISLHPLWRQMVLALSTCIVVAVLWKTGGHLLIPIALALLPIAVLITINNAFLVVLAFIIFSFFRIHEIFPFLMPFRLPILLALVSFTVLAWNIFSGKIKVFWTKELSVFAAFFSIVVVGAILATNRTVAFESLTGTYAKIAIIVLAITWMTQGLREFKLASLLICCSGILVALITLYNSANGIGLVEGTRVTIGRDIGSMLGDPNDLALVLLFPTAFGLSYVINPNIKWYDRALGLITITLMFAAILATQSRGGLLGVLAVMGVFAWYKVPSKTLLITGGLCGVLLLYIVAGIGERASGGLHEGGFDESAKGRLYAWEAAFWMAVHKPLTGIGISNFIYNYWEYSHYWDGKNHAVHSTWFGVLAETGFLGFSLFISLIIMSVRNMIRAVETLESLQNHHYLYAMAMALLAGFAGFCASGTFLTMGFIWPFYIMFGLSLALRQIVSQIEMLSMNYQP
ncbi:MAG: hypothetical protein COA45_11360 [Zetaproteobacteria bacterium]|nr:MAG: hypothetical protein COA45_11360 [Zetaproteobacteria bacterium]